MSNDLEATLKLVHTLGTLADKLEHEINASWDVR
jgi:hypothetical protein